LIADLDAAISAGQRLSFFYRAPRQSRPTHHERVEPHEIEFYDRHFYLVAYAPIYRQVFDFRIDRIQHDETFQKLDRLPPGLGHSRAPVASRYRLAAEVARGGISRRFAEQRVVEMLPNGDVIVEAQGRSDFFIIQTLLRYRANAELLEPAWLRERMREEVARLARLFQTGDSTDR
jgi:predicted DNA-binding transcriptional regulator YafY